MARIIKLHGGGCAEILALMPWYVAGVLELDEEAQVKAHLARCLSCAAEARLEERLNAEMAELPADVDEAWARMRQKMETPKRPLARLSGGKGWMGWALAAQGLVLVAGLIMVVPGFTGARYHALGAATTAPAGNVVVMFRPEVSEQRLRTALIAQDARIVGGPNAAGAYVLQVAPSARDKALAALRADKDIVLAQPVDAPAAP